MDQSLLSVLSEPNSILSVDNDSVIDLSSESDINNTIDLDSESDINNTIDLASSLDEDVGLEQVTINSLTSEEEEVEISDIEDNQDIEQFSDDDQHNEDYDDNDNDDDDEPANPTYHFHNRRIISVADEIDDKTFRQYYRMTKETFALLLVEVRDYIPDGNSTNGQSLSAREKLLIFLEYLASAELGWLSKKGNAISIGTYQKCVHTCIDQLYTHFVPEQISMPTEAEARREARLFKKKVGFHLSFT
jgi:hypothetical protein